MRTVYVRSEARIDISQMNRDELLALSSILRYGAAELLRNDTSEVGTRVAECASYLAASILRAESE